MTPLLVSSARAPRSRGAPVFKTFRGFTPNSPTCWPNVIVGTCGGRSFPDGSIAWFEFGASWSDGDVVLLRMPSGVFSMKMIVQRGGRWWLLSEDPPVLVRKDIDVRKLVIAKLVAALIYPPGWAQRRPDYSAAVASRDTAEWARVMPSRV